MFQVDLNSDMGESFGAYKLGGDEQIIKKVGGSQEMKQHLADMGFVPGGGVTVVSTIGGNVIVRVKESRVAISKEMAQKIMV